MPVLESRLVISAEDKTQAAFDAIEARIKRLSQTVASADKAVGRTGPAVAAGRNAALAARGAGGLGSSIAAAAAGAGGTYLAARAGEAAVRAIASRQHEQTRMQVAGESPEEVQAASVEVAKLATQFPNVSQTDLLHMLRNARSIVGSYKEAADIAEPLVKLRTLAQLARPGEDVSEDFDKLVKGLEIKGVTQNPAQFQEYMEGIAKGINVFGDTLRPYEYYEMFKYGRQASAGLSEKFILGTGPTLAQELGGEGFGAAVAQLNRLLVSGVGKKGSFEELARIGLINKDDVADIPGTGEGRGLLPGRNVLGAALAQSDPNEWVKQYLLPAFDKAGIKDKDEQLREIGVLFQSQRAGQLVDLLATQQPRIEKDTALLAHAQGLSAADLAIHQDPGLAWQGLKSSIDSLVGTTGESVRAADLLTQAAQALSRYTEGLTKESAAQAKGAPSPGGEDERRRLNRLVFGEDSAEGGLDLIKEKLGWLMHPSQWVGAPGPTAPPSGAFPIAHIPVGRDPRSPSTGTNAYFPPSAPVQTTLPPREQQPQGLTLPSQAQQPAAPASVTVNGQAQIDHTVHVEVTLDPDLRAKIDQVVNSQAFTVPLIGGGTGRMDSDAGAHRAGGIGSM
jgi:hypothetical protein